MKSRSTAARARTGDVRPSGRTRTSSAAPPLVLSLRDSIGLIKQLGARALYHHAAHLQPTLRPESPALPMGE